jgi:hypothetical protein
LHNASLYTKGEDCLNQESFIKLWKNKKAREFVNLFFFVLAVFFLGRLLFDIVSIATLHESTIISFDFVQRVWNLALQLLVLISIFIFFTKSKWYKTYSIQKYTGSHLATQLLTVFAILAGAFVSISSSEISAAINCHMTVTSCGTAGMDISFIGQVILLIVFFYMIHGAHSSYLSTEREAHENAQSENLRLAIQIAPPPYFAKKLADYSDIVEDMAQSMITKYSNLVVESQDSIINGEAVLDEQRKILRCALMALGRLAQAYDNVDPAEKNEVKYRANLMLCLKTDNEDVSSHFAGSHPKANMRFSIPFEAKPYFILYIDSRYSINVEQIDDKLNQANLFKLDKDGVIQPEDFELDTTVENASMPVYWEEDKHHVINYNVIGAPKSIVEGKPQFISDTVKEAKDAYYYSDDIQKKVISYFEKDRKGRSIVSLPVATRHYKLTPEHKENIDHFLGAINIYRNTEDIFAGAKNNFEFFADFTRPLRLVIARMAYIHIDSIAIVEQDKKEKSSSTAK